MPLAAVVASCLCRVVSSRSLRQSAVPDAPCGGWAGVLQELWLWRRAVALRHKNTVTTGRWEGYCGMCSKETGGGLAGVFARGCFDCVALLA